MRLNHLDDYHDIRRGAPTGHTFASRALYHVHKGNRAEPMTFIFALGRHVIDIRDAAHLFAPDMLEHLGAWTGGVAPIVRTEILRKAAPSLRFPRKPKG